MMIRSRGFVLLALAMAVVLSSLCPAASAWSFSSSSSKETPSGQEGRLQIEGGGGGGSTVADFSIDGAGNDPRGVKLLEGARRRIAGTTTTCWSEAYRGLFASCADIMPDKERQSRLAWRLSGCFQEDSGRRQFASCADIMPDKERQSRLAWRLSGCFQEDSGRPPLPPCDDRSRMVHCRKRLSESEGKVFLETNTLCHQLQAEAFKHGTERLVNDLSRSARSASEKLEAIEERSEQIMQESGKLHGSMASIVSQTEHLAAASRDIGARIGDVLERSAAISERSREIAAAQAELMEAQAETKGRVEAGMARVEESYRSVGDEMGRLREEAVGIEREIRLVGDAMASKMEALQSTADGIGTAAGKSLENQMQLLDGQAMEMQGLTDLYSFQSQALHESRETAEKLARFGRQQQEELLSRQEQIRQAHDHLMQNSESILQAQEEFSAKQASIFAALDKLHALHNAILVESRFIKAFFFYCCVVFLAYMLTSAKHTFAIRGRLYFGICVTLALEVGLIKLGAGAGAGGDLGSQSSWVASKVLLLRSAFLAAAAAQIAHSIFSYKDYEVLNHQLLQTLVEKIRAIEDSAGDKMHPCTSSESDGSFSGYSWIVDEQLQDEEADSQRDPDFLLPEGEMCRIDHGFREELGENSITTWFARKYNLRPRIAPR